MGRSLTAPYMNPGARASVLWGNIARLEVPGDVQPGGDLTKELVYENHSSEKTFSRWCEKRRLRTLRTAEKSFSQRIRRGRYPVADVTSRSRR